MYQHFYSNSLETEVLSADPIRLVEMLVAGAVEAVRNARKCLAAGDILGRSRQITKAQAIVTELALSLDRARGGSVAATLAELYDYIQRRLIEANFAQVDPPLADAERLLTTLADAWSECRPSSATTETFPALLDGGEAIAAHYQCVG